MAPGQREHDAQIVCGYAVPLNAALADRPV